MSYNAVQVQDFPEIKKSFLRRKINNDEFDLQDMLQSGVRYDSGKDNESVNIRPTSNVIDYDTKGHGIALSVDTNFGTIYLFDFGNFYQRLTGISVVDGSRLKMGKVNMANVLLPDAIYNALGWSIPRKPVTKVPDSAAVLSLKITMDGFTLPIKIAAETNVWIKIFNNSHWKKKCLSESRIAALPILVNTLCGTTTMTTKTWRSLKVGDVFIITKPNFDMHGEGTVSLGGKSSMLVRWREQGKSTIVEFKRWLDNMGLDEFEQDRENHPEYSEDFGSNEDLDDVNNGDADINEWADNEILVTGEDDGFGDSNENDRAEKNLLYFDEMPMEFSVHLGSFALTYRDACNLATGDIFKLDSPLKGQVEILCQNRVVACGDLVDIDGQLGVEIVRHWSMEQ